MQGSDKGMNVENRARSLLTKGMLTTRSPSRVVPSLRSMNQPNLFAQLIVFWETTRYSRPLLVTSLVMVCSTRELAATVLSLLRPRSQMP
ncbi:hypothetical protein D3C78_1531220 [compost metagenome]